MAIFGKKAETGYIENPDQELVLKAQNGDSDAFGKLIEKYSGFVYRTVFFDVRNRSDAEDLSQEVFIKAYRSIGYFRCDCEFSTWLYRICKNTVCDFARKNAKNSTVTFSQMSGNEENERPFDVADKNKNTDPEEAYISKETSEIVRESIYELSDEHRDIIILRDIEGMSYSDIAEKLSIEEGTVKSRLSRARKELKNKLVYKNIL